MVTFIIKKKKKVDMMICIYICIQNLNVQLALFAKRTK